MFKKTHLNSLFGATLIGAMAAVSTPAMATNEAMLDLLKILHDKGSITTEEYKLLTNASKADGEKVEGSINEMKAEVKADQKKLSKKLSWAEKIKIKGDARFRYENRAQTGAGGGASQQNIDRFRVRARVGAYAQVNDEVKAGIRLASNNAATGSGGSATSTNADLEDNFAPIGVDIDLAYLDWAPKTLNSHAKTNFIFGKMKKPWQKTNDLIWDGDTNPEGVAVKTEFKMDGFKLIPSLGYYVMDDSSGDSFFEDTKLIHAQLASKIGKNYKLGVSYFGYDSDTVKANTAQNEEKMFEVFGSAKFKGLPLPLTIFGSYVTNMNDTDELATDDTDAYTIGVKTKYKKFKAAYEWRDEGINAVNGNFNNSDFDNDSEGHIFKAGYKISKNFSFGATYFVTERNTDGRERDRLQVDLKAKF